MPQLTPESKHEILIHYQSCQADQSADDIAAVHGIKGGRSTILKWLRRWDGTACSLERRPVTGRPRLLSKEQVTRHIAAPIRNASRSHRSMFYTQLLPQVQAATGVQLSLRTLQQYGKEEAG